MVVSEVISVVTIVITHIRGLIAPLITTHEPPSRWRRVLSLPGVFLGFLTVLLGIFRVFTVWGPGLGGAGGGLMTSTRPRRRKQHHQQHHRPLPPSSSSAACTLKYPGALCAFAVCRLLPYVGSWPWCAYTCAP